MEKKNCIFTFFLKSVNISYQGKLQDLSCSPSVYQWQNKISFRRVTAPFISAKKYGKIRGRQRATDFQSRQSIRSPIKLGAESRPAQVQTSKGINLT